MSLRYVSGGVTAVAIVCSLMIGPALAQQRDGGLLPLKESGIVTVAGCLMRGDQISGGDNDKYVLANLHPGPVADVAEQSCTADAGATAVQLDNPKKGGIDESMLGKWVEVNGRLEKETSTDNILRELDVNTARVLPEAPRAVAAVVEPEPVPEPIAPEPSPAPVPVATSGQADLPKTASPAPLIAMLGLFAVAGSLAVRSFRTRQGMN